MKHCWAFMHLKATWFSCMLENSTLSLTADSMLSVNRKRYTTPVFFNSGLRGQRPAWALPAPAWLIQMNASSCGVSRTWWRDDQLNQVCWNRKTSNAVFPSYLPAWLYLFFLALLELFHHNMATCWCCVSHQWCACPDPCSTIEESVLTEWLHQFSYKHTYF